MGDKRRRRDQRADQPTPIRLTERDKDIIEAVHLYRVLRQDQLQALFFGTHAAAQRVLVRLYDHAFLERKFLPVYHGRSPTLYVLDRRGADLLRAERGYEDLMWYSTSKDLKADFLEHISAINDFRISVVVACRNLGFGISTWITDSQLKADYDRVRIPGVARSVSLIPDAYFVLDTPLGNAPFFLELDRGTETLERFKNKVLSYVQYHESGGYAQRYGTQSLRVLTVTLGEKRLENLKKATEQAVNKSWFWFATLDSLTSETILTARVWYRSSKTEVDTLIPVGY